MTVMEKCLLCRKAAYELSVSSGKTRNAILLKAAEKLAWQKDRIFAANAKDLDNAAANGLDKRFIDRLTLTEERIKGICDSIKEVASLPDPLGKGEVWSRPNGLEIKKKSVPIGVIGMIYEARPNVTADAAVLCIKSGNGVVLRGGKEAVCSSAAIAGIIREAIAECGISPEILQFIDDTSRESSKELMQSVGGIDLLIPRGGKGLIRSVVENAKVPVIETGAGNCHIYAEATCDIEKAVRVIVNAKTSRPSVCNAAEHLLVDEAIAPVLLPLVHASMPGVELRGDMLARSILPDILPSGENDDDTEYNDYIMSVKCVEGIEEAVSHINAHSTGHSECILTNDASKASYFCGRIDSAAVYVNASTRFTDGGEFGYGAEIGISTQKLHARGPMGLDALTTVKYVINGDGQIR